MLLLAAGKMSNRASPGARLKEKGVEFAKLKKSSLVAFAVLLSQAKIKSWEF